MVNLHRGQIVQGASTIPSDAEPLLSSSALGEECARRSWRWRSSHTCRKIDLEIYLRGYPAALRDWRSAGFGEEDASTSAGLARAGRPSGDARGDDREPRRDQPLQHRTRRPRANQVLRLMPAGEIQAPHTSCALVAPVCQQPSRFRKGSISSVRAKQMPRELRDEVPPMAGCGLPHARYPPATLGRAAVTGGMQSRT